MGKRAGLEEFGKSRPIGIRSLGGPTHGKWIHFLPHRKHSVPVIKPSRLLLSRAEANVRDEVAEDWRQYRNEGIMPLLLIKCYALYSSQNVMPCTPHKMLALYSSQNVMPCTPHKMLCPLLLTKCYALYFLQNVMHFTSHKMLCPVLLTKCYALYSSSKLAITACGTHSYQLALRV